MADSINRTDVETRRSLRLRSSSLTAVDVPVTRRSTIGDRAFPVAAARAWNSLPSFVTSASSLSTFKRLLKTYLFAVSYWRLWPLFYCLFSLSTEHVVFSFFISFWCVTCPCSFCTKHHVNLFVNNNNNNNNNNSYPLWKFTESSAPVFLICRESWFSLENWHYLLALLHHTDHSDQFGK